MAENTTQHSLGDRAAFQLANVTKTPPQYSAITPRWLVRLLDWKPLEAGTFRVNRVVNDEDLEVACRGDEEKALPETYVDYDQKPREYTLCAISTILNVQTRVSDLYSNPYDQIREQLRLTIESVKEKQESELVNNSDYGLLKNVPQTQRIKARKGIADAGRHGRIAEQGVEGAFLFPRSSARDCCVWAGMHASGSASANRNTFRFAISYLARSADLSYRKTECRWKG